MHLSRLQEEPTLSLNASKECCKDCPLACHGARGFVPDDVPKGCEILFRGEAPGSTEVQEGKPFIGDAGWVLRQWLIRAVPSLQIALEKGKVGFSNVLKCLPAKVNDRPYPTGQLRRDAEAHCAQFTTIPDTVKTIILAGEIPQRFHFPDELEQEDATDRSLGRDVKGVMGRVGRVYEKDGKRWVFAPHPAYILRQPALVQQGQEALRIAAGTDTLVEPTIVRWADFLKETA